MAGDASSLPVFRAFGREPIDHAHQSPLIIKKGQTKMIRKINLHQLSSDIYDYGVNVKDTEMISEICPNDTIMVFFHGWFDMLCGYRS